MRRSIRFDQSNCIKSTQRLVTQLWLRLDESLLRICSLKGDYYVCDYLVREQYSKDVVGLSDLRPVKKERTRDYQNSILLERRFLELDLFLILWMGRVYEEILAISVV